MEDSVSLTEKEKLKINQYLEKSKLQTFQQDVLYQLTLTITDEVKYKLYFCYNITQICFVILKIILSYTQCS